MLKSILIAGALITASSGYSLTFSPSAVHDAATFANQPVVPGFTQLSFSGGSGILNANGVAVSSSLTIDGSSVKLDGTIAVSPEGWSGYTSFYGQFTLSEASYVTAFASIDDNTSDANASTKASVSIAGVNDVFTPRLLGPGTYLFDIFVEAGDSNPFGDTLSFTALGSVGFSVVSAPDGGATVALLGLGVLGLAAVPRKLCA